MTIPFDTFVDEFDSSNFSVTEPKVDKDGRTQFTLLYNGGRVQLETPWFYLPFIPSCYPGTKSYSIRLTDRVVRWPGTTDEELEVAKERSVQFFKNIGENITDKLLDYGVTNSNVILGEDYERPVVKALFNNSVKEKMILVISVLVNFVEILMIKIYQMLYFMFNIQPVNIPKKSISTFDELVEALPKSSRVKTIIFPTLWAVSGKFGISWNVRQILLKKRVHRSFYWFCFQ